MNQAIVENKVVVFTGAGVSAESGLQTFRDSDGLWNQYSVYDVATPQAWEKNPKLVLDFYNERRKNAMVAEPNAAHQAIARLEDKFEVVVVTQNVDDLHERAGSSQVIHVHGELNKARSTDDPVLIYDTAGKDIQLGDMCERGFQLRPHIVWFGEEVHNYNISAQHIKEAAKVLVIGSSLSVFPVAGLVKKARHHAEKVLVSLDVDKKPYGYKWLRGSAASLVPHVVDTWLDGRRMTSK